MLTLSLNPSHSFSIDSTSSTLSIPPTSPFTLGLSLSHVLSILALPTVRALFPKYANADIKFDERDPISSPIVLSLPLNIQENNVSGARLKGNDQEQDESGLHLIFDGKSQRVQMIVLTGLQQSNVEIMYSPRGNLIHKGGKGSQTQGTDSGGLTRAGLHQFLGPTYPGVARAKTFGSRSASTSMLPGEGGKGEEVITSYPGVAFGFDVRSRKREGEKERTDVDNSHPVSSIYLFHGSTPLSPVPVLYPSLSIPGSSITKESTSSASWGSRDSNLGFSTAAQNGSRSFGCSYSPSGVGKSSNRIRGNYEANGGNEALMAHINELERGAVGMGAIDRAVIEPGKSVKLFMHPPSSQHSTAKNNGSSRNPSPNSQAVSPIDLVLRKTTPQDVICELGAPQSMHWKEDDRLSIHSQSPSNVSSKGALFYSYFALGFDLMFSGPSDPSNSENNEDGEDGDTDSDEEKENPVLLKVILHNNVPGSALFGRYGRCCWVIGNGGEEKAGFDKKFESLQDFFDKTSPRTQDSGPSSRGRKSQPSSATSILHLDRASSPTGSLRGLLFPSTPITSSAKTTVGLENSSRKGLDVRTTLHGLDGLVVEEDQNGWIVGVTIV